MGIPIPEEQFVKFLCDAKRATYAAKDDRSKVAPILGGSNQLEFRSGPLWYRDIYFGGDFFVGQETVYHMKNPFWGMSYAGGINKGANPDEIPGVYEFLTTALRQVPLSAPFRGPSSFIEGDFDYKNRILGDMDRFSGVEIILFIGTPIYQLHYSGGVLLG
jgi:hypothetical protein